MLLLLLLIINKDFGLSKMIYSEPCSLVLDVEKSWDVISFFLQPKSRILGGLGVST